MVSNQCTTSPISSRTLAAEPSQPEQGPHGRHPGTLAQRPEHLVLQARRTDPVGQGTLHQDQAGLERRPIAAAPVAVQGARIGAGVEVLGEEERQEGKW